MDDQQERMLEIQIKVRAWLLVCVFVCMAAVTVAAMVFVDDCPRCDCCATDSED